MFSSTSHNEIIQKIRIQTLEIHRRQRKRFQKRELTGESELLRLDPDQLYGTHLDGISDLESEFPTRREERRITFPLPNRIVINRDLENAWNVRSGGELCLMDLE